MGRFVLVMHGNVRVDSEGGLSSVELIPLDEECWAYMVQRYGANQGPAGFENAQAVNCTPAVAAAVTNDLIENGHAPALN